MHRHDEDDTRTVSDSEAKMGGVLRAGTRIQQFEILSLLGSGGMGQVYVALDHRLDRKVAIKRLPAGMNDQHGSFERFQREARAASALNHPNIVTIYDSGESEWGPYIVMELIEGSTLRELIRTGLPLTTALDVALQAAEAARVAHAAGIVHRDLKPDNILVRNDGYVKVVDFGLARVTNVESAAHATTEGAFIGTLRYASPEQGRGSQVDERSDVFSLGLILYQMTTGRHPFEAGSALATLSALSTDPVIPASVLNPEVPADLDALILRMLEKAPPDRPPSTEVAEALRALVSGPTAAQIVAPIPHASSRTMVGRGPELDALMSAFQTAQSGRGHVVCVAGEAGMGKSTLVESFIGSLGAERRRCLIGSGRSSQRLAGADAYAPLLEALASQLRSERTGRFAREMKHLAPSWYALVASVSDDSGTMVLPKANSQDRMKQELYALFQRVGRDYPIVLVFEDFHWADLSTADAVVYLADRFDELRLLLILSYRESELLQAGQPFVDAKLNMQARGVAHEVRLHMLSRSDVENYLALVCPANRFGPQLPDAVYRRTGGHPLFVADLVAYLREFGGIREEKDGTWVLDDSFEQLQKGLPESVRSMVERKLAGVTDADRRLLTAAAVQGYDFDSAVLSRVLEMDAADVEEQLEVLDRVFALVALVEETEMPDRTLTSRYRFRHMLYQDYCIGLLRPSRKASISRATARTLEAFWASRSQEVAAKLAVLYEAARDFPHAAEHFLVAAANATSLFGHREAAVMARRGLEAVLSQPPSAERDAQELRVQLALGGSLCMTMGYASKATVACFSRAMELALAGSGVQGQQIWGLWLAYTASGNVAKASELSDRLLRIDADANDSSFHAATEYAAALTNESVGRLRETREHVEEALRVGSPGSNRERMARFVLDPSIAAGGVHLRVLTLAGFSDLARQRWDVMRLYLDQESLDPRSICDVLISGACYFVLLRRHDDARDLAMRAGAVCERYDIFLERQWAAFFEGWARSELGDREHGLTAMRGFLDLITGAGCLMHHSLYISLFVEALLRADAVEEARVWVGRGLALVEKTGQRFFECELHRLAGEIEARSRGDGDRAQVSLARALALAVDQDARLLEMRAALSLGTVLMQKGAAADAVRVLSGSLARMPTGFESPEYLQAKAVLQ